MKELFESLDFSGKSVTWKEGLTPTSGHSPFDAYHRGYRGHVDDFRKSIDIDELTSDAIKGETGHLQLYWYTGVAIRTRDALAPGYVAFTGKKTSGTTQYRVYGYPESLSADAMRKYGMKPETVYESHFKSHTWKQDGKIRHTPAHYVLYDWREVFKHGYLPERYPDGVGDNPPETGKLPRRARKSGEGDQRGLSTDGKRGGGTGQDGTDGGERTDGSEIEVSESSTGDGDPDAGSGSSAVRATRSNYEIAPETDELIQSGNRDTKLERFLAAFNVIRRVRDRFLTPQEKNIVALSDGSVIKSKFYYETIDAYDLLNYTMDETLRLNQRASMLRPVELPVARAMWSAARRAGFSGGRVYVPNADVGRLYGTVPADLRDSSSLFGFTEDPLNAETIEVLYPLSTTKYGEQDKEKQFEGWFDLVLTAAPHKPSREYGDISDYRDLIAVTERMLRPGGVAVVSLERDSLQASAWPGLEVVGAFRYADRVNNDGWLGTLALLWKRPAGAPSLAMSQSALKEAMGEHSELEVSADGFPLVDTNEFAERMEGSIATFQPAYMTRGDVVKMERARERPSKDPFPGIEENEITLDTSRGTLRLRRDDKLHDVLKADADKKERALIIDLLPVIKAMKSVFAMQQINSTSSPEQRALARRNLGDAYDRFIKNHGSIHGILGRIPKFTAIDINLAQLLSLEKWDSKTRRASKTPVFDRDVVHFNKEPTVVNGPMEAMSASLGYRSRIDMEWMADISGLTQTELVRQLKGQIYRDPDTDGWVYKDEYLSGDILKKLARANAEWKTDPAMEENVRALEAVRPTPKTVKGGDLVPKLGAPYVPDSMIKKFVAHLTGEGEHEVTLTRKLGADNEVIYSMRGKMGHSPIATQRWGTHSINVYQIIEATLNGQQARIKPSDRKSMIRPERFEIVARQRQSDIANEFIKWVKTTPSEAKVLEQVFNQSVNRFVTRDWSGESQFLQLHGGAQDFFKQGGLRSLQRMGITRAIRDNTYFVHGTGYGKTYSLIASAIEARWRGFVTKPLLAVQSNKVEEVAYADVRRLYPTAKVLIAKIPNPFSAEGRGKNKQERIAKSVKAYKKEIDRIRAWNGDLIIISHSSLDNLRTSIKTEREFLRDQLSREKEGTMKANRLNRSLKKLADLGDGDIAGYTFENTGIDMISVDESHHYKNTPTRSTTVKDILGASVNKSKKAKNFADIANYVRRSKGRIVLASATPFPNSPTEMYTLQELLDPSLNDALGIMSLDDWLRHFAVVETQLVANYTGDGYFSKTRIVDYLNAGIMYKMGYQVMDTNDGTKIKLPAVAESQEIVATPSSQQKEMMNEIKNKIIQSSENMLTNLSNLRMVAIDARVKDRNAPRNRFGKIDLAADKIAELYQEMNEFRGVTVLFSDRIKTSQEGWNTDFNVFTELRRVLVEEKKIPAHEIAIWKEVNDLGTLQRKIRKGDIRVLLATTQGGGTGVNYQERVGAVIHFDMDWTAIALLQRTGRAVRPGNIVTEEYGWDVQVISMAVKDSIDTFMLSYVRTKARTLQMGTSGKGGELVRTGDVDDSDGGIMLSVKKLQEASAGSSIQRELNELQPRIIELQFEKNEWDANVTQWRLFIATSSARISELRTTAKNAPDIADRLRNSTRIEFEEGGLLRELSLDNASVAKGWNSVWEAFAAGDQSSVPRSLGTLKSPNGEIVIRGTFRNSSSGESKPRLQVRVGDKSLDVPVRGSWKSKLDSLAENVESEGSAAADEASNIEKQADEYRKRIDAGWEKADKFEKTIEQMDDLKERVDREGQESGSQSEEELAFMNALVVEPDRRPDGSPGKPLPPEMDAIVAHSADVIARIAPGLEWKLVDRIRDGSGHALGAFRTNPVLNRGTVQVAEAAYRKIPYVLRHEAIHYLRHAGLFSSQEWDALVTGAKRYGWIDKYRIPDRYPDMFEDGKPNPYAYEEAVASAYADWAQLVDSFRGLTGVVLRLFQRIRRFLYRIGNRIRTEPEVLFEALERGDIGRRIIERPDARTGGPRRDMYSEPMSDRMEPYKFESDNLEERVTAAMRGRNPDDNKIVDRLREWTAETWRSFRDVYKTMPNVPEFAQAHDWLRHLSAAPSVAAEQTGSHIMRVVSGLDATQRDFLTRVIFMSDFAEDLRLGIQDIPFFESPEEFRKEFNRMHEFLRKPEYKVIRERRAIRDKVVKDIGRRMVAAGLLPEEILKRRGYITHEVLEYAKTQQRLAGSDSKLKTPKWARRKGTTKEINFNLLEAEASWMQRALVDLRVAETLDKLRKSKRYNKREELLGLVREHNRDLVDEKVKEEWLRYDPESYREEEGQAFAQFLKAFRASLWIELNPDKEVHQAPAWLQEHIGQIFRGSRKPFSLKESETPMNFAMQLLQYRSNLGRDFSALRRAIHDAWETADDKVEFLKGVPPDMASRITTFADIGYEQEDPEGRFEREDDEGIWDMLRYLVSNMAPAPEWNLSEGEIVGKKRSPVEEQRVQIARWAGGILGTIHERRQFKRETFGDLWIESDNIQNVVPALRKAGYEEAEGLRAWQPDSGRLFYTATTISQKMTATLGQHVETIEKMMTPANEDGEGGSEPPAWLRDREIVIQVAESMRQQMVVGGPKYQMALPEDLANTLDNLRDDLLTGQIEGLWRASTRLWKQWTLINPQGVVKYNIRNTTGDLDHVIAAFGLKPLRSHMLDSTREMWRIQRGGRKPTIRYRMARDYGVIDSGFALGEMLDKERDLDVRVEREWGLDTLRELWRHLARLTGFRENIFRYTVFNYMIDDIGKFLAAKNISEWKADPKLVREYFRERGYGGIHADRVVELEDFAEIAAYVARETLGDYGHISHSGRLLRETAIPFWSFREINAKFYSRAATNVYRAFKDGGSGAKTEAARTAAAASLRSGVWLGLRIFAYTLGTSLWGWLWSDAEDELTEEARLRPHITIWHGKDNIYTIPAPGALTELLQWVGYSDVLQTISDSSRGRGSLWELPGEVAMGFANSFVQGMTPLVKVPIELIAGMSAWPDIGEPRALRSRWYHFWRSLHIDTAVDQIGWAFNMGRPNQGPLNPLRKWIADVHPVEYAAYTRIRQLAFNYRDEITESGGGPSHMTKRARTVWYWKLAKRFGDEDAEKRFREDMQKMGITRQSIARSIASQHPLGMLPVKDRRAFLATLHPDEKESYKRAVRYYRTVYGK